MRWPGLFLLVVVLICSWPHSSAGRSPLFAIDVVNRFCEADGRGDRVQPRRWAATIAPLVAWRLEPAWDRVVLISGYQVNPARVVGDHLEVEVEYTVVGAISSAENAQRQGLETVAFAMVGDDRRGWRIAGPPPAPHLFANIVDADAMSATLDPESSTYVSASAFAWHTLRDAGWAIPYRPVSELRDANLFAAVDKPKPGDLALFLHDDTPYQVGIVSGDNRITAATVNAGLVRTPVDAFAGTVLYLRLRESLTPRPVASAGAQQATATPPPATRRSGHAQGPNRRRPHRVGPAKQATPRESPPPTATPPRPSR
jgi:hypothetical protein